MTDALEQAYARGVLLVSSAGNDGVGTYQWPAWMEETICVGASNHFDLKAAYSNYGNGLDVLAPSGDRGDYAVRLWVLDRMGELGVNDGSATCEVPDPNYYCWMSGTSAAQPVVAGIATLILSRRPDLIGQPARVQEIIRHSAEDQVGDPQYDTYGWDQYYGWGRVNADRALLAVVRGDGNNDGLVIISDAVYIVNYVFGVGPEPQPKLLCGDADCSGVVDISDVVYLIQYILAGGPAPQDCFIY